MATIDVEGIAQDALAKTTVTYSSAMPTMSMSGASGTAVRVTGQPNRWTFPLPMAEATQWTLTLHFAGGFTGSANFAFDVIGGVSSQSGGAMAAMGTHEDIWRSMAIALAILIALGALAALLTARSLSANGRMPQWLNRSTVTLAAIAVIVVIVAAALQSRFSPPSMDMSAMSNVQGVAPIPVTLARAERLSSGPVIAAPGMIQALFTQDVVARAPGLLRDFTAYNGTHVFAGETLAYLEEPELGAQASAASASARSDQAAARAAMIEARHHAPNELAISEAGAAAKAERSRYWRSEMQREKLLLDNGAVSQQEYDDEKAQAAAAYADAESAMRSVHDAMANLEMTQQQAVSAQERAASSGAAAEAAGIMAGYTRIVAPSDGIVLKRLVDPGSYVQSGTPVLRIAVINKARIQANVAQEDLSAIRTGSRLDATLPSGRVVHATITSMQPAADPTTHTAQVEAIVDNSAGRLVPGTYVRVTIFGTPVRSRSGVSVPSAAIVGAGPDTVVWTEVNDAAHRVPVRVLSDDGTTAQVAGEIKSGDRVVVEGATDLEEGMPITERPS
ncbi:MAG: efflux RND transporter periplasmic adaptor subunit [Candidatus Eremiobacteraeota bacterium]|nr:efflux RND transporter periplasmic adaptor subunit [Candidatus Eremiobacteraeota bacterium]